MKATLVGTLDRADELLAELETEYNHSLRAKEVSQRAIQITHEVCERLRSILDRTARTYWEEKVAPDLSEEDRKAATVYFPISKDQSALDSTLGRWRWKSVRAKHQDIYDYFRRLQPFVGDQNQWLFVLNDISVEGKHVDLLPQKRTETRRITVQRGAGSVSWSPENVRFSSNVYIMGQPVNPATQRIVPSEEVEERIETWINFVIGSHGVNALGFCKEATKKIREIAEEVHDKFDLS